MKYEMEIAEEVFHQMDQFNTFIEIIKKNVIHYAFPYSYYNVLMILISKDIENTIFQLIKEITHVHVYKKGNTRWFYIIKHSSGYEKKIRYALIKNNKLYETYPQLSHFLSFYDKVKDEESLLLQSTKLYNSLPSISPLHIDTFSFVSLQFSLPKECFLLFSQH